MDGRLLASNHEIGAALKRFRGRRSLRDMAEAAHVSKSSLSRYENGAPIPLHLASVLDRVYSAQGWIEATVLSGSRGHWDPWRTDEVSSLHVHTWPSGYSGLVAIHLRPTPATVGRTHQIRLAWGPWSARLTLALPRPGSRLMTGKSRDEVSVPVQLDCDPPVHALFLVGAPDDEPHVDIRSLWYRAVG
ncbi:helix-turn-helix domain-containing protein [Micromonospora sp. CPCC 205558]|uniref:helix-turn-helix domain-containing protein n=1 Tax=Micromonospora sp. CPCC 205558 TaxID=3122403 RepID=UPI002FF33F95